MLRQEFCQKFVCSVRSRDDDEGLKQQQQQQQQSFPKDQPGLKNSEFDPRPKKKVPTQRKSRALGIWMAKTIWEKRGESRYFMCQHNSLFSGNSLIVKIIYLRMCAMRSELVLQGVVVLFHSSLYLKFLPKALFCSFRGPERERERECPLLCISHEDQDHPSHSNATAIATATTKLKESRTRNS